MKYLLDTVELAKSLAEIYEVDHNFYIGVTIRGLLEKEYGKPAPWLTRISSKPLPEPPK